MENVKHGTESITKTRKQSFAFAQLLKMAGKSKDLERGAKLHADIQKRRLHERSPYVASALISMYSQCGVLAAAENVLEELPLRDVVSWNSLIAGYVHERQDREALTCFERMQREGVFPNEVTFICILKACSSLRDTDRGRTIHKDISYRGLLEKKLALGNSLVGMYAKCGLIAEAQQIVQKLPVRDIFSWNALIAGYAQEGKGHEALKCFADMQKEGISPNEVTFNCILKACSSIGDIHKGNEIHNEIACAGLLKKNVMLGNALVDMYAKCGVLPKALEVFEELPVRNVISWNALIAGYVQHEQFHKSVLCYASMQKEGISANEVTFVCILKACGSIGTMDIGKKIHEEIICRNLLQNNSVLGTGLVDMYARCDALVKAQEVLAGLPVQCTVCWSTLIARYAQRGDGQDALNCFEKMQRAGFHPNEVTFICALQACGNIGAINKGMQIHAEVNNQGLLDRNIALGNALVDMYAKCGMLMKAQELFEELPTRNIATWNALISGYAQHGKGYEALVCFTKMQRWGISPDEITFACILKACGSTGAITRGKQIHEEIANRGILNGNIVLGNALVDMYAKCGFLSKAHEVLEELPSRDTISWNALIAGYVQAGHGHEALDCFVRMQRDGIIPNEVTLTCILKACSIVGAVEKGKQIHDDIIDKGFLQKSMVIATAVVDMYTKCGMLAKAQQVLEDLSHRDTISWSALIAGYAQEGYCEEALNCLERMQREGLSPNKVTLLCVLKACGHSRELHQIQMYYESMSTRYGVTPQLEHHTCMVATFGHAGCFDKAISIIETMPSSGSPSVWLALLGACRKWGNVEVARLAFRKAVQLDDNLAAAYILMLRIYTAAGLVEDAREVEALRVTKVGCKIINVKI